MYYRGVLMKKITTNEIGCAIAEALAKKKKNILFVSNLLRYENLVVWFNDNKEYKLFRFAVPQPLYEEKNGLLIKNEEYFCIDAATLNNLNTEKSVLFSLGFSEKSVNDFEGYLNILKERFYINRFPEGLIKKHELGKMPLFIAFSTPSGKKEDWASLDEKYYTLFDDVYVLDV